MDLKEIGITTRNWVDSTQNREYWRALVNATFNCSCPSQEIEVTSTPTRPVDNVVIATKGLQYRNTNIIAGTTVGK